jgi:hypothetical protein
MQNNYTLMVLATAKLLKNEQSEKKHPYAVYSKPS